jgi:hypothetical protein
MIRTTGNDAPALRTGENIGTCILLGALIAAVVGCILVLAAVPPVDRDALTHHLAVPKLYLKHGGIYEIPAVPFSYYPMNLDLLYLIPLYFGNDILPKYIHFGFALLTAILIFSYLRRRLENTAFALLGALLFLSLPVIVKLSITVYVDLGLIFFSTAALLRLFRWAETGFRARHLILAGVFAGLCLGTKYNGLIAVFLLGLCVPVLYLRMGPHASAEVITGAGASVASQVVRPLGYAIVFSVIALAVFSPWTIRNYIWTSNPLYPLSSGIFSQHRPQPPGLPGAVDKTSDVEIHPAVEGGTTGLNHFSVRQIVFGESLFETLLIPVRIFLQGEDDSPRLFDGRLNPYLLLFPLVAVFMAKKCRNSSRQAFEQRVLAGFSLVHLFMAFLLTDMRIRYIAPIIPPLVILTVFGVRDLACVLKDVSNDRLRLFGATGGCFILAILVAMNGLYIAELFDRVKPRSYLNGDISRDEYIQQRRSEYATITYINRHLSSDARVLCLFTGNRIYYSDREMVCDSDMFRSVMIFAKSPDAVVRGLLQRGISHLLIRGDVFHPWADAQFHPQGREMLQTLFRQHFKSVFDSHGYFLFQIVEE